MTEHPKPKSRRFEADRAARIAAVQACYQWEKNQKTTQIIHEEFIQDRLTSQDYPYGANANLFTHLFLGLVKNHEAMGQMVASHLPNPWTLETLDPVLKSVLITASFELWRPFGKAPGPVIITEYVDIAEGFCGEKEAAFCNKNLDQLAQSLGVSLKK